MCIGKPMTPYDSECDGSAILLALLPSRYEDHVTEVPKGLFRFQGLLWPSPRPPPHAVTVTSFRVVQRVATDEAKQAALHVGVIRDWHSGAALSRGPHQFLDR